MHSKTGGAPVMHAPRHGWFPGLPVWLAASFIAAALGGVASVDAGPFYMQLVRPDWAPPPGLFGPVWSVLYTLIGIAAWLVWRIDGLGAHRTALVLFLAQLGVNALWSWLFFGWHLGGLAFADVLLLWVLILATMLHFWRASPLAGVLLLPYLLWVSFAAVLNFSVWQLNPGMLGS